jgi:hypothetical protein
MKQVIFLISVMSSFVVSHAQDATVKEIKDVRSKPVASLDSNGWKKSGTFILNISQGALSNWVAGGENNTLGVNSLLNYSIDLRQGKNIWDNYFDFALGFQNATSFQNTGKLMIALTSPVNMATRWPSTGTQAYYLILIRNSWKGMIIQRNPLPKYQAFLRRERSFYHQE